MADERALAQEDQWWAVDALPDPPSPASSFDEPLQWPDSPPFVTEAPPPLQAADAPLPSDPPPAAFEFPVDVPDDSWLAALDISPLDAAASAGLPDPGPGQDLDLSFEPLPECLWGAGPDVWEEPAATAVASPPEDQPPLVTSAVAVPESHAEPAPASRRWRPRRPDLRHGNAAMVALISFVSLVLLGMFLSVRARNDMSTTDTSASRPSGGQIAVQGTLNTIPPPTSVATTTTAPPPISLTDLLPPADAAGDGSEGGGTVGSGSGGSAGGGTGRTATTAAPARSAAPTGGGSGSGGGAAQPAPANPPADQQPATTAPTGTTPPVDDTRPPRPTTTITPSTDFTIPDITMPDGTDRPTFPWPSGSGGRGRD